MQDHEKLLEKLYPDKNHEGLLNKCYCKVKESCNPLQVGAGVVAGLLGYSVGYLGSLQTDLLSFSFSELPKIPSYLANIQNYAAITQLNLDPIAQATKQADEVGRRSAAIYGSLGYFFAHKIRKSISAWRASGRKKR